MGIARQFVKASEPKVIATIPAGTKVTKELVQDAVDKHLASAPKIKPITLNVPKSLMRTKTFKDAEASGIITKVGRPPSGKVVTTLRLDPRIIEKLKADGDGWQARANDILLKALNL